MAWTVPFPAIPGARLLAVALIVLLAVAAGPSAHAASVSLSWSAPTTNADGSPLTDLASYRIYLGTTAPSCPGGSFHTVASATARPTSGQIVSTRVTALSAGTTYFARVTAIDTGGNESGCSPSASGVAQPDFAVTPVSATSFGSIAVGGTADRTFTVQNTSSASLSGAASVGAPFSIVSGASFTLAPGASQAITVRFRPTTAGAFAGNVTFTAGGDSISRGVSGSTTGSTTATLSVSKNGSGAGTVISAPAGIACGSDCTHAVAVGTPITLTASAASGSVFTGWSGACNGTGTCAVTVSGATTVTATFATSQTTPPPSGSLGLPGSPTVTQVVVDASGVTFTITWGAASGAASYSYAAAFNDGSSARQGTVTAPPLQLRMPYHASGAAVDGFVCVRSISGTGQQGTDHACNVLPVPARPAGSSTSPPPAPGAPSVTRTSATSTTVTFTVAWNAVSGATSYRYGAAFDDGSAQRQGTVTTRSFQLVMPYHASGAAFSATVCIWSVNGAGQQSANPACSPVPVPARPVAALPPSAPPPPPDWGWGVG